MNRSAARFIRARASLISMLILHAGAGAMLAGAVPAVASEGLAAAVWPMLGASPSHSSRSSFRGPDTNQLAWRFDTNSDIDGGVAIDVDGTVFFGTGNGRFFAVDQTGRQRWSVANLTPVIGVPVLARGGKIYVTTNNGKLYALDVASGKLRWTFDTRSPITASAAVGSDGTIYVATRTKGLFAVTPLGAQAWNARVDKIDGSSPAVGANGVIYVGTTDGRLVALAPAGSVLWNRAVANGALGSPAIVAGGLYVGAADGWARAIDPATGNTRWAFRVGAAIRSGLSVGGDGTIYFGAADRKVYALKDAGNQGQLRWATLVGGRVDSTPAIDRTGAVFVGSDDRNVYALDAASGAVRWSFATGGAVDSALAIGIGGRVFAGSSDRSVYAIGEFRSGADCWNDAFIDPTGLTPEEVTRRFQILLAACGGPGVNACGALVQGGINADRFAAARQIASQQITPAQYLAILRDRTRKLDALTADGGARLCGPVGNDADGDFVPDNADACPGTPPLTPTLDNGCTDSNLPRAPSADLIRDGLEKMNLLVDKRCDQTVPELPSLTFSAVSFSGVDFDHPTQKEFQFTATNNQAPGCDVFYEMEVFYRPASGDTESFYAVFPRSRGVPKSARTTDFKTKSTDAGTYGALTRSKAFVFINNDGAVTRYRLRATNYAGVRSVWGPLTCYNCKPEL